MWYVRTLEINIRWRNLFAHRVASKTNILIFHFHNYQNINHFNINGRYHTQILLIIHTSNRCFIQPFYGTNLFPHISVVSDSFEDNYARCSCVYIFINADDKEIQSNTGIKHGIIFINELKIFLHHKKSNFLGFPGHKWFFLPDKIHLTQKRSI